MFSFFTKLKSRPQSPPKDISAKMVAYNETRSAKDQSSFCYAPSINMYFSQDGHVKLCCPNMEYSIGKYPDQSIAEIWHSEAAKKIRQDMREYRLYEGCNICKADVDMGAYQEVRARHFDSLPTHAQYPTMMEFLLTNTCNLECVMCKGEFSSLIRQNREKLPPIPNVYDDNFIEQLKDFIPHLREARFSGSGEAFLIDANYKIWDMILELNPQCLIMVQTNGMVLNSRIKDLLSRGNFQIGVSLDSLRKEVFEAIRPHAKFERVMENIQYFNTYAKSKKIKFSIALCVMRQNWRELPDYVRFANSFDATVTFHKVCHPMEFSLQTLSKKELQEIVSYLSAATIDADTQLGKQNVRHFKYILDSVRAWEKEATAIIVENLSEQELMESILDQSLGFIKAEYKEDAQVEHEYSMFKAKFERLIEMFRFDGREKKILVQMYRSDFKFIFPFFKHNSERELYTLSLQLAPDTK
jgi:MoaA/NifB/PqqE/SkfB family radical SAM enzyme